MIELKEIGIVIGLPVARSVAGWLVNALQDGAISDFEWARLGETVLSVGIISGAAYIGFAAVGFDVNAIATTAGAILFDSLLRALKKGKTAVKA